MSRSRSEPWIHWCTVSVAELAAVHGLACRDWQTSRRYYATSSSYPVVLTRQLHAHLRWRTPTNATPTSSPPNANNEHESDPKSATAGDDSYAARTVRTFVDRAQAAARIGGLGPRQSATQVGVESWPDRSAPTGTGSGAANSEHPRGNCAASGTSMSAQHRSSAPTRVSLPARSIGCSRSASPVRAANHHRACSAPRR